MWAYSLVCCVSGAALIGLTVRLSPINVVIHAEGLALAAIGLLAFYFSFVSTTIDASGIRPWRPWRWRNIPWAQIASITAERAGRRFKRRQQIRITLENGRKYLLPAPVNGIKRQTNPNFENQLAEIVGYWQASGASSPSSR
jgi:hypothetical protein